MISLEKAKIEEAEEILEFYQNVIDSTEGTEFRPKWNENYPNLEYVKASIEKEELYFSQMNGETIACVVLNNQFDPEYEDIDWIVNAKPEEITVIHTFAVSSNSMGNGIGKEIFRQIKNNAIENSKKTIRIDIINGNIGAQKVFEKFGFKYVDSVEFFHTIAGMEKFHLYEFDLNEPLKMKPT